MGEMVPAGAVRVDSALPAVVHCRRSRHDVYIGRPSPFGNPFVIGKDGGREEVIRKYEAFVLGNADLLSLVRRELKGKVLGCWCAPLACHGDVLVRLANGDFGVSVWTISVHGYGEFGFVGTELEAEDMRIHKSRWEQGAGKKRYERVATPKEMRRHERHGGYPLP